MVVSATGTTNADSKIMGDEKPEVDGAQPRRTVEGDRAHAGVVDQVGDEEEGGGGEGGDHARPVGGDAAAADEHVPGAEEDRRRAVQRGVDLGKPGRPAACPPDAALTCQRARTPPGVG